MNSNFLPVCKQDLIDRNIQQLDFVYVIGDAYVDHPSFGYGIISRILESRGYSVGIISQPDWKDDSSIQILGEPRLGFLICAGNMDSMVNHYTVSKKKREQDAYSPGGVMGLRPDYATICYGNLIRKSYKHTPIIIGGIEASLRRLGHYDYWSNKVKRSILLDSCADLLLYGMGEHSIIEVAEALDSQIDVKDLTFIKGTVYKTNQPDFDDGIILPTFPQIVESKKTFAESFYIQYQNTDPFSARKLIEPYNDHTYVVQNPPSMPLTQMEMDDVYALPYTRTYHPSYKEKGGIPAIQEIQFSLVSNRGCFGGCNFCALTFHQGRIIQTRSHESIIEEATAFTKDSKFKGYIHDVGGPTANFRHPSCAKQLKSGVCKHKQCLFPKPCEHLNSDHSDYIQLLRKLRAIPKVKKVFIRSGIRFDYLLQDKKADFLKELCEFHVSGQLKVAPEHISDQVLDKMGKPSFNVYKQFCSAYEKMNRKLKKDQYMVPYLMSSHPGSTLKDAIMLAEYLRDEKLNPQQVQDFYPTPSTISTCMYYTGIDPRTGISVYVATNPHEKAMQRALVQYRNPANYDLVMEALRISNRMDLVGFGPNCLIPPRKLKGSKPTNERISNRKKPKRAKTR